MDYLNFPEDWSGRFEVRVMSSKNIDDNLRGIAMWGPDLHTPNLREALEAGRPVVESLTGYEATVRVLHAPSPVEFDLKPVGL
jgi:hypothetical protein